MTANELLRSPLDQLEYKRGRVSALPPDSLNPGELYRNRLLLPEVILSPGTNIGVYAIDALVEVEEVSLERRPFAVIHYVTDDGLPEGPAYTPVINEDGIIRRTAKGTAAPLDIKEGYFLHPTGSLEDELQEMEEGLLVRVHAVPTRVIADEQSFYYQ